MWHKRVHDNMRITPCRLTDSKGDRSKAPAAQEDADQYVRVVERRADGVVIRGAEITYQRRTVRPPSAGDADQSMKPGEAAARSPVRCR